MINTLTYGFVMTSVVAAFVLSYRQARRAASPAPGHRRSLPAEPHMQRLYIPIRKNHCLPGLYWSNPKSINTVIFSHHFGGNKEALVKHARLIYGLGYSVLLFDYSNHGENKPVRKWNLFKQFLGDLEGAIEYIAKETANHGKITLFAFSLTTFVALHAASKIVQVEEIICDSGPAHSHQWVFERFCDRVWSKHRIPCGRLLFTLWCRPLFGAPSPKRIARSLKNKRILIIQGDRDNIIPEESVLRFCHDVENCEIHYESFPGANHLTSLSIDGERYAEVVQTFLLNNLQTDYQKEGDTNERCFEGRNS